MGTSLLSIVSEVDEDVSLVGVGGAAAGQVGKGPDGDERHSLLIADEGNGSTLHVNRADIEFGKYEATVRSVV
ncbi:hypothetical protein TIFTF001_009186 [Ficus carica]|uniref:Uncharacterized protein n=1 Tax=Ficus carica TaxID=3494 RepID=A0AA88DHC7_FICCA|nr:hypothetical protein TIFTF001_009186 [Ficus carica]